VIAVAGSAAVILALVAHALLLAALRHLAIFSVIAISVANFAPAPARPVLPLVTSQFAMASAPDGILSERLARTPARRCSSHP